MTEVETITISDDEETPPRRQNIPRGNFGDSDDDIILESDWWMRRYHRQTVRAAEDDVVVLESETVSPLLRRQRLPVSSPPPPPPSDQVMRRTRLRLTQLNSDLRRRRDASRTTVATGPTIMVIRDKKRKERKKGSPRPIVIDGCNVAMAHGNDKTFSVRGLAITVDFFLKRGHTKVVAFLPQDKSRGRTPDDREVLEKLKEEGHLVYTPSRQFRDEVISSYDDTFILDYAAQHGAVVVTRDNFRDLANNKAEWDLVIRERILMPTFVGEDSLIWPHNPLGIVSNISLDDFLKF